MRTVLAERAAGCEGELMFDPQRGYPWIVPYVRYRDPAAAIAWLTEVVGVVEAVRMTLPDGRIGHAELRHRDTGIAVGLSSADRHVHRPVDRDAVRAMTLVFVADVDASTMRAVELGGTLIDHPTDMPWGLRQSIVCDPEGHVWELSAYQRDVPAQDWGARTRPASGFTAEQIVSELCTTRRE